MSMTSRGLDDEDAGIISAPITAEQIRLACLRLATGCVCECTNITPREMIANAIVLEKWILTGEVPDPSPVLELKKSDKQLCQ